MFIFIDIFIFILFFTNTTCNQQKPIFIPNIYLMIEGNTQVLTKRKPGFFELYNNIREA